MIISIKIENNTLKDGIFMNKYKNKSNISGKIIHDSRIEHNLSLEKLSNKLELLGVTLYPNDIYLIEKEQRIVKDFELMAICKILDIDVKDIKEIYQYIEKMQMNTTNDEIHFLPFWENGVKFFTIEGPNKEKIEFSQYL